MSTFSCGAAITKVMAVSPEDTNFIFDKIKELEGLGATLEQAQKSAVADAIIRLEKERQEVLAAVREKLDGMEKESKPDAKASFWREGVNNETQRPVYNFNPDSGAFWASVQNPSNGVYAIEYKNGQAVVETDEITGSLTQVKFHAQERVAKIGGVATHQDPGQKPEAATAPVIAQSLAKAARKDNKKPSEMRKWLLDEIDKAIESAPDERFTETPGSTREEQRKTMTALGFKDLEKAAKWLDDKYEERKASFAKRVGHISFDVPGDGKFKIVNTKEHLQEFRAKVSASPGFKNSQQRYTIDRTGKYGEKFGVEQGSGSTLTAIKEMIDEGDPQAAVDYAAAKDFDIADALKGDKIRRIKIAGLSATVDSEQETGDFGPILTQFKGDAQGAINALTELQNGEAVAALHHPEVGDIDLVWGKPGTGKSNGFGLAKLRAFHPEILDDLQGAIDGMSVVFRNDTRVRLESATHEAGISLDWFGRQKTWLLTAYEKDGSAASTTMNTADQDKKGDSPSSASTGESVVQPTPEVKDSAQPSAQPAAKAEPDTIIDAETSLWNRITDGTATVGEFKAGFENWVSRKAEIVESLMKNTKDQLLKMRGIIYDRYKNEPKAELVDAMWRDGANRYVLARSFSHGMGKNAWLDGVRNMVENTDADQLAQYAQQVKTNTEEAIARVGKIAEAIKDPKTLEDYITWMRATMREGKTFKDARMMLTLEQRSQFDELAATESRSKRKASKDEQRTSVAVAGQVVDGNIIATKHTKKGHDVFVVQLAERVSKEDYDTLNAGAKRIGGYYSSFRGAGATPGFQFTDRAQAEAFVKLAQGDNTDAKAAAQANRDAFEDDRSQTAVQRLTEMAARLEEQADASLNQERKTNTSKRAGQAARAEAAANSEKAMAKTMRNIATAISDGTAKFLDRVRQKVQVSMLLGYVNTAKDVEMRAKYASYSEQERHKGEPPTAETADFAEFPTFTASRSDLASLARQLLDVDGTKLLGQRLLKEADDVSDAYLKFSKENTGKVMIFRTKEGGLAGFSTKGAAEESIARSGYKGKAIAYQVKRGEYTVIASPSEAVERGIWKGDGDKRLTLTPEIGAELVEKIGKAARRGAKVSVPWQLETAHDRRKALARMGIETPAEFRAALREFIGLQEQAAAPSKVKELERAMIGRRNDGMDFFPTPESVADEMVTTAGIEPGMAVLEPSAGWGHIAERIRAMDVEPDVIELSGERRELLEAKGFNVVASDFTGLNLADLPDGNGYDRILMNPPFSDGRDIQHVQHAYTLLKPGGRIVAIMGESAFTNQNKRATEFREWLESVGGTEEKLAEGSFNDPTLPVNTGANARMVVIDRAESSPNDGAVFSARTSAPEKQLALQQIERLVQSALRGVKNAPTVRVVANPEAIGLRSPVETIPSGAVLANGDIYVFQSGIGSALDVDMVVFHELFHKGLQNVMPRSDYVAAMQDIARIDAKVRQYASEWSATNAGKDQLKELAKKYSGQELADQYEALATEEGLARIAEGLKAKREMGTKDMRVRRLVSWLVKMADKIGMTRLADSLRAMSYSEAEKFVIATIGKAGWQVSQNATTAPDSGGARFRAADTLNAAANNVRNVKLPAGYLVGDLINGAPGKLNWWHRSVGTMYNLAQRSAPFKRVFDSVQTFINDVSYYATEAADLAPNILPKLETWKDIAKSPLSAADTKAISAPIFEGTLIWMRDDVTGQAVKVDELKGVYAKRNADRATRNEARRVKYPELDWTLAKKKQALIDGGFLDAKTLKMWEGQREGWVEKVIEGKFEKDLMGVEEMEVEPTKATPGIVFTDAELKSIFNLTDKQIPLYREFRAATDKSLTNLAIADMLRFGGEDVTPIRETVLASKDVTEAAETLRDYLLSIAEGERNDVLTDTANKMIEKGDKAADLIKRGYAPLSRFGQYTLDVVHNGERVYFGMFESKWEAARMNRQMQAEYPGAKITQGTVSEQAYKMFAGVSPETLELFGDMLGLEAQGDSAASQAFQEYLKLAKSSRSAMKRLIHRKGIAGFNEDAGRVLAGFVYSNARQTASSLHMGEMTNAANDISQTQGELKDAAVKLVDYIKNPQEEAQKLRGLLFAQYIGGSVASAMVNMTQPLTMTFPWLSQYGTISGAAKQMTAATKDALKRRTGDAKLDAALHRAEEDGTVSPQEVHQLMQQAQGKGALQSGDGTTAGNAMATAQNSLSRFSLAWGKLFSTAEQFNRRVTFIAAYRTAIEKGMADPDIFARKAIAETQGVYNKGNKPAWARGAIGSTLFTFKQYSIAYMEMLSRMAKSGPQGKKAALLALGVLFLMSGAGGMPGADDLDDLISGALQALGYNFDSKARRKEFFVSLFGDGGAQFVERGVSGLPGVPIDVSGRMGLGNLIPGTGLFTKKTDHTRDVAELAGPAGDLANRTFEAAGKLIKGDAVGSAVSVSPKAFQNLHQAYDMANMGMYRDASGKKVIDTDGYDAIAKAIGFQPTDVKRVQDASIEVQRMIGLNKMRESEIADKWALGLFEKDPSKVQAARDDLKTWNADNADSPIRISFGQIAKRVQKMNETKTQRIAKTAPREIRATVRRELATP